MRQAQKRREVEETIPHEHHKAVGIKNYLTAQPNNATFKIHQPETKAVNLSSGSKNGSVEGRYKTSLKASLESGVFPHPTGSRNSGISGAMTGSSKKQGSFAGAAPKLSQTITNFKYKPQTAMYLQSFSSRVSNRVIPSKTKAPASSNRVSSAKRQSETAQFPTRPPKTMTFINNKNSVYRSTNKQVRPASAKLKESSVGRMLRLQQL